MSQTASAEGLTPYDKVIKARDKDRPNIVEYIKNLFSDFYELKGDRLYREDPAILGGIAMFHDRPVTVIGHRKGKNIDENMKVNFGMPCPEGYRKSMRLMRQAEKFGRPVITFVDTPGAYPGMEAESNGQSNAIAESMALMSTLTVPVIVIVTGEGSSGGALALGVGNSVYMLENAVYSILSPEGFASIMWKDGKKADEAAKVMKLTADELYGYRLIDGIISEGKKLYSSIDKLLYEELKRYDRMSGDTIRDHRYKKFRNMGRQLDKIDVWG